jgi:uncharacterized membrane protein SirB2
MGITINAKSMDWVAMRSVGIKRWGAFILALVCFGYIISVAVTKHGFI